MRNRPIWWIVILVVFVGSIIILKSQQQEERKVRLPIPPGLIHKAYLPLIQNGDCELMQALNDLPVINLRCLHGQCAFNYGHNLFWIIINPDEYRITFWDIGGGDIPDTICRSCGCVLNYVLEFGG